MQSFSIGCLSLLPSLRDAARAFACKVTNFFSIRAVLIAVVLSRVSSVSGLGAMPRQKTQDITIDRKNRQVESVYIIRQRVSAARQAPAGIGMIQCLFFGLFVFAAFAAFAFGAFCGLIAFAAFATFAFGALVTFTFGAFVTLAFIALGGLITFAALAAFNGVGALLFAVFFYFAALGCFGSLFAFTALGAFCALSALAGFVALRSFIAFAAFVAFLTFFGLLAGVLRGLRSGSLSHSAQSGHGCSHDKCQNFLHNWL